MQRLLANLLSVDMRSRRRAGSRTRVWRTRPAVECLELRVVLEATTLAAPMGAADTYLYANYDFNWPEEDPELPGGAPYYIQIDNEVMEVTAGSPVDADPFDPNPGPDLLTVVRNISGSAAGPVAHANGATITDLGVTYTGAPTLAAPLAGSGLTTSLQITNPPSDVVNGDLYTLLVDSENIVVQANAGYWYILARGVDMTSEAAHDAGAPIDFGLDDQGSPPNLHTALDESGGGGTTFFVNNAAADPSWTYLVQIGTEKLLIATTANNLAGYEWNVVARGVDGTQAQAHGAGSEVLFFGPTTAGGQGGGTGGGTGGGAGGATGEATVEFADPTIKLFVSGKSGSQTTTVLDDAAEAGTVRVEAFVSVKPAAKKGGKQTTDVVIGLTLTGGPQTPVYVDYDLYDPSTTASPGKDFTGNTSGTITFQPGETYSSITIQVRTAKLKQAEKSIVYAITNVVNAGLGTNSTTTVDVVDAALGENEMKRSLKAQLKIQSELFDDLKASTPPSKLKRIVNLVTIDAGLKNSADGYAPIYKGDNVFDALYLKFASGQQEIINLVNRLEASDASTEDAMVHR